MLWLSGVVVDQTFTSRGVDVRTRFFVNHCHMFLFTFFFNSEIFPIYGIVPKVTVIDRSHSTSRLSVSCMYVCMSNQWITPSWRKWGLDVMQSHPLRRTCSACAVDLSASDLHICLVPSFFTPCPHCTENAWLKHKQLYTNTHSWNWKLKKVETWT